MAGAPDTGGVDLGPIGGLQGSIPGLDTATRLASRTPEWRELGWQARQAGKDFNDGAVAHTVGVSAGQPVLDAGLTGLL